MIAPNTEDIKKVLVALSTSDLRLKPSNCELYKEEASFLWNVFLQDGHAIFSEKTRAISEFGVPRNKAEVRGFLFLVNFLRRFCKEISQVFAPLT